MPTAQSTLTTSSSSSSLTSNNVLIQVMWCYLQEVFCWIAIACILAHRKGEVGVREESGAWWRCDDYYVGIHAA